jgi:hypothetical protein
MAIGTGVHRFCFELARNTVVAALFLVTSPLDVTGQARIHGDDVFVVAGDDLTTLTAWNTASNRQRVVYRSEVGRIFDFKVAQHTGLVAVLEQQLMYRVDPKLANMTVRDIPVFEKITLHVLSAAGSRLDAIDDVRMFAWSPDGRQLAYVTGQFRGSDEDYANTRTWIWDATDNRRLQVSDRGYYVEWAGFDGNVYLWDKVEGMAANVYRYDVMSRKVEPTSHKSIYFSPTGTYYYHPGGGIGLPQNVYLRATDVSLTSKSQVFAALTGWRPLGWAPNADLLLMEVNRKRGGQAQDEPATIVYDPRADTSIDVGGSEVIGWGNNSGEIIVKSDDRFHRRAITR